MSYVGAAVDTISMADDQSKTIVQLTMAIKVLPKGSKEGTENEGSPWAPLS